MNVDRPYLNTISLFSGVGMLDEGFHAGLEYLGLRSRTVMFAEREDYPVAVLAARMEEGSIPPAPIWFGDLCELDAGQFRGVVDCVVAGFPCQDLSVAGKRAGLDGKRSGLFFEVVRIATDSGARFILLENVAGIASATATVVDKVAAAEITGESYRPAGNALGEPDGEVQERAAARVLGELADLGWDAEWITLSASDVGASHGRARWFCIAWRLADTEHAASIQRLGFEMQRGRQGEAEQAGVGDSDVGDPERICCKRWGNAGNMACACRTTETETRERERSGFAADGCCCSMADTSKPGLQGRELGRACHCNGGGAGNTWIN